MRVAVSGGSYPVSRRERLTNTTPWSAPLALILSRAATLILALVLVGVVNVTVEGGDLVNHVGLVDGACAVQSRVAGVKSDHVRLSRVPILIDVDLSNVGPDIAICPAAANEHLNKDP